MSLTKLLVNKLENYEYLPEFQRYQVQKDHQHDSLGNPSEVETLTLTIQVNFESSDFLLQLLQVNKLLGVQYIVCQAVEH